MMKIICEECGKEMKKGDVEVEGAKSKSIGYFCKKCGNFEFDKQSAKKVINELKAKETPLNIEQKIIKLSHNRMGIYFNKDLIRSLNLKHGEKIYLSVPDKKHIILNLN